MVDNRKTAVQYTAFISAVCSEDMNLPGLNLHEMTGARKGTWSVKVSGNWRITFKFVTGEAADADYEDYH
jgi:proteic killer suppression protein